MEKLKSIWPLDLKKEAVEDTVRIDDLDVETNSETRSGDVVYLGKKREKYVDEWNPDGLREPTEEEKTTLRRTIGHAPYACYLICLIEFAERGSYYGVTGCLTNFIQRPLPAGGNGAGAPASGTQDNAGALGLGLETASALTLLLTFLAYCVPLYGGFIADTKIGKMKAIWIGVAAGALAHIILIIASIPSVIAQGHAIVPTAISIIVLAFGTGFIKPNLLPLLMDQYPEQTDVVKVLPTGESIIIDRQATLERMTLVFYWAINIGAFLQLATSYCEKRIGFWLAYLVPGILYMLMPFVLIWLNKRMVREQPKGSVLENSWRVFNVTFFRGNAIKRWRNGTLWDYALPSKMLERGETFYKKNLPILWTDQFVLDVKQTLNSCKIFIYFIIFNINDGGIGSIETSQAGAMTTNGVPNDLFNNFNPLTIIVLIPILDYCIYPLFRRYGIVFKPVYRITFGFILAAASQVAGAVIQYRVYQTSPCGYDATGGSSGDGVCDIGDGVSPISAWQDVSLYILSAAGECFANTTAYELAYTRSPKSMKGLVMALFLFTSAISAAISEACTASLVDPYLIWPFAACAIAGFVSAGAFLIQFWNLDKEMEKEKIIREDMLRNEDNVLHAIQTAASNVSLNLEKSVSLRSVSK
ncbi:hypothetical protein PACTADRAFT_50520 [Pachysolen tannophilus NRRL Y-2460]|uniref:Peptide transporter PTR2 n=1 Tax=Pachysolen tannophilus NRRL Y-2460 TaxID=669874 RepID=A0A1E4TSE1_PACTA|nr:hypothetical protein PACTADRAFT_50520 [Pachysolen tannophilus NRRL Y-2460]